MDKALNNFVVSIDQVIQDDFDGHTAYGFSSVIKDVLYSFYSNFDLKDVPKLMDIFQSSGFPEGSVGICKDAIGFLEETHEHYPVDGTVGVYFHCRQITNEMFALFREGLRSLYQ